MGAVRQKLLKSGRDKNKSCGEKRGPKWWMGECGVPKQRKEPLKWEDN